MVDSDMSLWAACLPDSSRGRQRDHTAVRAKESPSATFITGSLCWINALAGLPGPCLRRALEDVNRGGTPAEGNAVEREADCVQGGVENMRLGNEAAHAPGGHCAAKRPDHPHGG